MVSKRFARTVLFFTVLSGSTLATTGYGQSTKPPLVYQDTRPDGIGTGKHIVFLAGDHEYRSEETLPAIARILAKHHGFKCTVLFNVNSDTGFIEPGNDHMPGTEALATADLMVVFLRLQNLPDKQMRPIADYLDRGGPVVGLRTATHAFRLPEASTFSRFSDCYELKDLGKGFGRQEGFGRQVLGEGWAGHYGTNHVMSTRLEIPDSARSHPVLRGVTKPWVQCGGYWAKPMPDSVVLCQTQPLQGMKPESPVANDKAPCPGVWVRSYKSKSGISGRVFTTTSGASEDILNDDFRRLVVNGCLWTVGLEEKITAETNVSFVGPYHPVTYDYLAYRLDVRPQDLAGWVSPIMPTENPVQKRVPWGQPRPKRSRSK